MAYHAPRRTKAGADAPPPAQTAWEIYTDGACLGNPGPGGWAFRLLHRGAPQGEQYGAEHNTTSNRMELLAALRALEHLASARPAMPKEVTVHSDSRYLVDGMASWIENWQRNGWKNYKKKPVANADLWQDLISAARHYHVHWNWVPAHSAVPHNEWADKTARDAATQIQGNTTPLTTQPSPPKRAKPS